MSAAGSDTCDHRKRVFSPPKSIKSTWFNLIVAIVEPVPVVLYRFRRKRNLLRSVFNVFNSRIQKVGEGPAPEEVNCCSQSQQQSVKHRNKRVPFCYFILFRLVLSFLSSSSSFFFFFFFFLKKSFFFLVRVDCIGPVCCCCCRCCRNNGHRETS